MDPFSLIAVGVAAAGSVALLVRSSRKQRARQREAWTKYAERAGARLEHEDAPSRMQLWVERDEALVRVCAIAAKRRNTRSARTLIEAYYPAQGLPSYHLYWDYAPDQIKVTLTKDHLLGDELLDRDYIFASEHPDLARPALLHGFEIMRRLTSERLLELRSDGESVRAWAVGVVTDVDTLDFLVELVALLASARAQLGCDALRELPGARYVAATGPFEQREPPHATLRVQGIDVRIGPAHGGRDAPWPSTVARARWPHAPAHTTVHIDSEGALSGESDPLQIGDTPERLALRRAVGRARLRLIDRELALLWPNAIDDRETLLAGAKLVATLCALTPQGAYR